MPGTGTVTGLAGHVDVGPARRIGVGGEIVVLLQIGRMAIGALVIPGLVAAGPVQPIARRQFAVRIEVEPVLSALLFRATIPGDAERLITTPGKGNQVLLQ